MRVYTLLASTRMYIHIRYRSYTRGGALWRVGGAAGARRARARVVRVYAQHACARVCVVLWCCHRHINIYIHTYTYDSMPYNMHIYHKHIRTGNNQSILSPNE